MGLLKQTQTRRQLYTFVREDQDIPFYCEQSVNCLQIMNERHHANQTLLLQSTETVVPSLNRLRCALEADLAASVGINVYWSPPNSVGFKLHHDGHDIIVVQTAGKKCNICMTIFGSSATGYLLCQLRMFSKAASSKRFGVP